MAHHLHGAVVDEPLCSDAVHFVHEVLLVGEEAVQLLGQLLAHGDAQLVPFVQVSDN